MTQKRSYKQYPKEFKEEAVALVLEQGYSVPEAAKSLDITANMLYRWKELHEQKIQGKVLVEDEREELKRLRKENKELRMEKEILKKASVLCKRVKEKYTFIKSRLNVYRVNTMCRVLNVHRSGFYAWLKEPQSKAEKANLRLLK